MGKYKASVQRLKKKLETKIDMPACWCPLYKSLMGDTAVHLSNKRQDMSGIVR